MLSFKACKKGERFFVPLEWFVQLLFIEARRFNMLGSELQIERFGVDVIVMPQLVRQSKLKSHLALGRYARNIRVLPFLFLLFLHHY